MRAITRATAYYLAYAISKRDLISKLYKQQLERAHCIQILLYLLSKDEVESERAAASDSGLEVLTTWGFRTATFEDQFKHYSSLEISLSLFISQLVGSKVMSDPANDDLFKISGGWLLFVSDAGKAKLKQQFPDIWNSWGLS